MNDKCPNCGADIEFTTICTNPPINVKQCRRCGWKEEENPELNGIINFYERVIKMHNCNDCGKKFKCEYCPRPGDDVRFNCPLWEE